tara:strand:- start:1881 stop:2618 length:738 start_codon:yes stop_codon:yes gene_type:complete
MKYNKDFKKKDYIIKQINKAEAYKFVKEYHYLADAKFFSKFAYGLFLKETNEMLGVTTFSNPQGAVTMKGWFSLTNQDQTVLELSRLCVIPRLNNTNATSFLLGTSIRLLRKEGIRAVITLADNSRHSGSIYQVCNFTYYGLSNKKSDFFLYSGDGTFKKNYRGKTNEMPGVWLPRTQKHRYAYILDKTLLCNYTEQPSPKKDEYGVNGCPCDNGVVEDKRFQTKYTCPSCTNELKLAEEEKEWF